MQDVVKTQEKPLHFLESGERAGRRGNRASMTGKSPGRTPLLAPPPCCNGRVDAGHRHATPTPGGLPILGFCASSSHDSSGDSQVLDTDPHASHSNVR